MRRIAVALGMLALGAAACTSRGEPPAAAVETSGNVRIEFRTEPSPPASGDNAVEVTVRRPDGTPVTDAHVDVLFSMPAMPSMNMPAMRSDATLTHESAGRYRGTGRLSMGGTWNVTVSVARGSEELGSSRFSVIAK